MTSAKRYTDDNHPERYEFSVKYTESRHYTPITMKRLGRQLHKHLESETGFIAGIRYRDAERRDHWFNINLRDLQRLCDAIDRYLEAHPDEGDTLPVPEETACEPCDDAMCCPVEDEGLCEPPAECEPEGAEPLGVAPSEDGSEVGTCTAREFEDHPFEERKDDGPHTEFRFCCYAMMDAMLGGSGIMISLDSGELQIGERNLMYCPFCGQSIITHTPPAKVE